MITQDFPPATGGIQTYSLELARRLARRCEHFELIAPADAGHAQLDADLPFAVHRLPVASDRMAAATVPATLWHARKGRFDAVFHAQWYTAHAGLLMRRMGRVRRVFVAAHGRELLLNVLEEKPVVGAGFERIRNASLRAVDRFFAVSRYTGTLLERHGVAAERVTVIPNGVDPTRLTPVNATGWRRQHELGDAPLLMTISRLVPRKGVDTVLAALPKIGSSIPSVRYVVGGAGPDRSRLERLAREHGVSDRVHFVGRVPDDELSAALSAANVFVMPARSEPPDVEGFGLVFLEANACGTAVVGARAGGVPDAIVAGVTGELVEPDDPAGLAVVLGELLSDPVRAANLGAAGRERVVESRSWDAVADRLFAAMVGDAHASV